MTSSMSQTSSSSSSSPPPLIIRWLRPQTSSAHLDLPTAPVSASSSSSGAWQAFTELESEQCEAEWKTLSDEERAAAEEYSNQVVDENEREDEDDEEEGLVGVIIGKDRLFEVNVRTLTLSPIFWRITGPPIRVMRATWMYDEHHPVERNLADQIEEAYIRVKPWQPAYQLELSAALEMGTEAHGKLTQPLEYASSSSIVFEDASAARILSNSLVRRVFDIASLSFRSASSKIGFATAYGGARIVYRGYDAAVAAVAALSPSPSPPAAPSASLPTTLDDILINPKEEERQVKLTDETEARGRSGSIQQGLKVKNTPPVGNDTTDDVTDLILIIHGIGQGLVMQYEAFNFVYAANLFRQIARKQSTQPALASIMRNRRVQFLPIQWRANLKLTIDEEREREHEGLDNKFSLADITIQNHIPFIRELTNNVLIDVPYFMSHHRERMIQAVCIQANRTYRRWCVRNPHFEKQGKVHIIGHSLGSALAAHILSNQPTIQPPLSQMDSNLARNMKSNFLFDTSNLFMVGSPLGVFLHIGRAQLIARKGRERTMKSPSDEALDRVGTFGCLAVDSIYNVFKPADPIVYLVNPCVDAKRAKELPPSAITSINESLMTSISTHVTRIFDFLPFRDASPGPGRSTSPVKRPSTGVRALSRYELGGPVEKLDGTRAERRFAALNPHGTLDFYLPSEGKISEYVDMLTAHAAYWADPNFAAFVLAEVFANKKIAHEQGWVQVSLRLLCDDFIDIELSMHTKVSDVR